VTWQRRTRILSLATEIVFQGFFLYVSHHMDATVKVEKEEEGASVQMGAKGL
jgi:hypothetical protein